MVKVPCKITVLNIPKTVSAFEKVDIEVQVELFDPAMTLGFVFLTIPEAGETLRFAKKSADRYVLTYQVPGDAPSGCYSVGIYATADDGSRSDVQRFDILLL